MADINRRRRLFKIVTPLAALLAALALVEVATRLLAGALPILPPDPFALPLDGIIHRLSNDPDLVWELVPNAKDVFQAARVTVNSHGMRSAEIPLAKPAGSRRVGIVGDSITFGAQVNDEETFAARLQVLLDERFDFPVQVINGGVSGYNAEQIVAQFLHRVAPFEPDLAIVSFYNDDLSPSYVTGGLSLWDRVASHIKLVQMLRLRWWHLRYQRIAAKYDWRLAEGWKNLERTFEAYRRLLDWASAHQTKVLFLIHPDFTPEARSIQAVQIIEWLDQWRVPYVEMHPAYSKAATDITEFSSIPARRDPHPNAAGHALIAETLADAIVRDNLLSRP